MPIRPPRRSRLTVHLTGSRSTAASPPTVVADQISLQELQVGISSWLAECEAACNSPQTIAKYKLMSGQLVWFLTIQGYASCGRQELVAFQGYLNTAHTSPEGRWGKVKNRTPLSPGSVQTYWTVLRTLFTFLVKQRYLAESPMETIRKPIHRPDQVQPLTEAQIKSLIQVANASSHPRRNVAILTLLYDSGIRASELCGLRWNDVVLDDPSVTVEGKGGKKRKVYLGNNARGVLYTYKRELAQEMREEDAAIDMPFFLSDRGTRAGDGLTRSGLLQLLQRLGKRASITGVRVSPHTLRHSYALAFLRSGGNVFALKENLGHTSLGMVNRYLALSSADTRNQQRRHSPADSLRRNLPSAHSLASSHAA